MLIVHATQYTLDLPQNLLQAILIHSLTVSRNDWSSDQHKSVCCQFQKKSTGKEVMLLCTYTRRTFRGIHYACMPVTPGRRQRSGQYGHGRASFLQIHYPCGYGPTSFSDRIIHVTMTYQSLAITLSVLNRLVFRGWIYQYTNLCGK